MYKVVINPVYKNPSSTTPLTKIKATSKRRDLISVNPIFKDQDVFIVGGGYSLTGFNFNLLKGKNIIAINKSIIHVPFAQVLYFSDYRFYLWCTNKINGDDDLIKAFLDYKGLVYTIASKIEDPKVKVLLNTGKTGLDIQNGKIKHGGNSGYAAINLAYHLGAKRIILLGYDMKQIKGKTHFHKGYLTKQNDSIYKKFIEPFESLSQIAKNMGLQIINTSMDSDLIFFKKEKIENFL
jgi:hypothetical protein